MNSVFKILNNQFHLFDEMPDNHNLSISFSKDTYTDETGVYKIKYINDKISCGCHPETCNHFEGSKIISYQEKEYLNTINFPCLDYQCGEERCKIQCENCKP